MNSSSISKLEVDYARFNALKTLATEAPSAFECTRLGELYLTRDHARPDAYYNRILGLSRLSVSDLDAAVAWIGDGPDISGGVRIDISSADTRSETGLEAELRRRGFVHVDTLMWLALRPDASILETTSHTTETDGGSVRPLSATDWPALRQLLRVHGPITDAIWREKRVHLCTDTFRWCGIFDGDQLVSAASTWITHDLAILGSAYTLPAWRGRGYQRRLLDHRCHLAGADLVVDVEPGSTSYRNCVRAGFTNLETRQVWEQRSGD